MYTVSPRRKASPLGRIALVAGLAAFATVGSGMNQAAHAQELVYGITTGLNLFSFNSASPGVTSNLGTITGVSGTLQDIDFRPANGLLYGLSVSGSTFNLYTISTSTAAATLVTALTGVTPGVATYDIDFNPTANALRIVGSNGDNFRVPTAQIGTGAGATTTDTALNGGSNILGVAYTNNVAGAPSTTLYDINGAGQLYRQGDVGGAPTSPNTGTLTAVGSGTGITASEIGFDISGVTGNAYLATPNTFYTLNLTTGTVGAGSAISLTGLSGTVRGISAAAAAAPEPGSFALMGTALLSVGGLTVRRRAKKA